MSATSDRTRPSSTSGLAAHEPADAELQDAPARLWRALARVLDDKNNPRLRRLAHANTSVTFAICRTRPAAITLLLDRDPPELRADDEPAAITITLTPAQAEAFARGDLPLPVTLAVGAAGCSGPVRQYLAVDAILRSLLAARAAES